jgi:hypothetical protein
VAGNEEGGGELRVATICLIRCVFGQTKGISKVSRAWEEEWSS